MSFCRRAAAGQPKGGDESFFALDPHGHVAGLLAWLDVNDARATADGAVFGVGLPLAAAQVDGKLVGLAAERALDDGP